MNSEDLNDLPGGGAVDDVTDTTDDATDDATDNVTDITDEVTGQEDEPDSDEMSAEEKREMHDNSDSNSNRTNTVTFEEQMDKMSEKADEAPDRGNNTDRMTKDDWEKPHTSYVGGIEPGSKKNPDPAKFIETSPNVLQEGQNDVRDGSIAFVELNDLKARADRLGVEYSPNIGAEALQTKLAEWSASRASDEEVRAEQRKARLDADLELEVNA